MPDMLAGQMSDQRHGNRGSPETALALIRLALVAHTYWHTIQPVAVAYRSKRGQAANMHTFTLTLSRIHPASSHFYQPVKVNINSVLHSMLPARDPGIPDRAPSGSETLFT